MDTNNNMIFWTILGLNRERLGRSISLPPVLHRLFWFQCYVVQLAADGRALRCGLLYVSRL